MQQAQLKFVIPEVNKMKNTKNAYHKILIASGVCIASFMANADDNAQIQYSGTLIALPCTVEPGMDNLYIDMGETDTRVLYRSGRGMGIDVNFSLKDCSTNLGNSIVGTFSGNTNSEGYLAFAPDSEAKGAAIGLEYLDGRPITIGNGQGYSVPLIDGDMTVRLKAFLKGEKTALESKGIVAGRYTAMLTYTLSYE